MSVAARSDGPDGPADDVGRLAPDATPPGLVVDARGRWRNLSPRVVRLAELVALAASVAALVVRFTASSPLWLDEAQSVAIARRPLGSLLGALRHDGSPPLYYLLLHGWLALFGDGAVAVRSLSAVVSLGAAAALYVMARRLAGRGAAQAAVVLFATSPFAMRYGSEARMYALVMLLVAAGAWCLLRARAADRAEPAVLTGLAALTALTLLTHYWALFLVAVVAIALAWRARHEAAPRRALLAVAAGAVATLWWLPSFVFQVRHTGAPWATTPTVGDMVRSLRTMTGGADAGAEALWLLTVGALAAGAFGRRNSARHVELRWRADRPARAVLAVGAGTIALALAVSRVTRAPVPARYAAVAFPLLLAVAARGISLMPRRTRAVGLAAVALLGLGAGVSAVETPRTQAGDIAGVLRREVVPGDVVLVCPDQLGPALARLLPSSVTLVRAPDLGDPALVDWVDYRARVVDADPWQTAAAADRLAGVATLWLVVSDRYNAVGETCRHTQLALETMRPDHTVPMGPWGTNREETATLERLWP